MANAEQPNPDSYPLGRGYGHDYMRGGEVFGGYGHEKRDEFAKPRGELQARRDPDEPEARRQA